jgi:hypothetical protein
MRLGAIDLHVFPARARALKKLLDRFLGLKVEITPEDVGELQDLNRIVEAKLATARPRRG